MSDQPKNVFSHERGIISTALGDMPEHKLIKTIGIDEGEDADVHWVECRMPGSDVVIHRSAHAVLKHGIELTSQAGQFGG